MSISNHEYGWPAHAKPVFLALGACLFLLGGGLCIHYDAKREAVAQEDLEQSKTRDTLWENLQHATERERDEQMAAHDARSKQVVTIRDKYERYAANLWLAFIAGSTMLLIPLLLWAMRRISRIDSGHTAAVLLLLPSHLALGAALVLVPWLLSTRRILQHDYWEGQLPGSPSC